MSSHDEVPMLELSEEGALAREATVDGVRRQWRFQWGLPWVAIAAATALIVTSGIALAGTTRVPAPRSTQSFILLEEEDHKKHRRGESPFGKEELLREESANNETDAENTRKCTPIGGVGLERLEEGPSVWPTCTAKWTHDCSATACCTDSNMKCFRKNEKWAACQLSCQPDDEPNETWSCEVVTPKLPRTAEGCLEECRRKEDCKQSWFTSNANGQCFLGTEHNPKVIWAGLGLNSSLCGDGSPEAKREVKEMFDNVTSQLPFQTDYPLVSCSWGGEDCSETRCCNDYVCDSNYENCNAYSCWTKDEFFSGCGPEPEQGWNGTWLGGGREHRTLPPALDTVAMQGTSLYCFTVVTWHAPRPKPFWNSEAEITNNWIQHGVHIIQCDGHDIFDGQPTAMAEWGSFSNIDLFRDIWRRVGDKGQWRNFDWTVKVDTDAVFFPNRLKTHLETIRTPKGSRVYLENINFKFKFMGAIEIMTREALELFLDRGNDCIRGEHAGGEDSFVKTCLDGLGIDHQSDWYILRDRYAGINPPCLDGWAVAYHYFKKMRDWSMCYNEVVCGTAKPKGCGIPVPADIPLPPTHPPKEDPSVIA